MLNIQKLSIAIGGIRVVHDCSMQLSSGKIYVLMGPNGSGKSSLVASLMGHPSYEQQSGTVTLNNQSIDHLPTHQRSQMGLFLAMQHPVEIPGLQILDMLKQILAIRTQRTISVNELLAQIRPLLELVGLSEAMLYRSCNVGFSGGEKKRFELLQLLLLQPSVALLDELDSGVDIDGLKHIAQGLMWYKQHNPNSIILLVSHYRRLLDYLKPDIVHVMMEGTIVATGDHMLLNHLDQFGYESYAKRS